MKEQLPCTMLVSLNFSGKFKTGKISIQEENGEYHFD